MSELSSTTQSVFLCAAAACVLSAGAVSAWEGVPSTEQGSRPQDADSQAGSTPPGGAMQGTLPVEKDAGMLELRGLLEPGLIEDSSELKLLGKTRTNQFVALQAEHAPDSPASINGTPSADLAKPNRVRHEAVQVNPLVVDTPPLLRRFHVGQRLDELKPLLPGTPAKPVEPGAPESILVQPNAMRGADLGGLTGQIRIQENQLAAETPSRTGLAEMFLAENASLPADLFPMRQSDRTPLEIRNSFREAPFTQVQRTPLPRHIVPKLPAEPTAHPTDLENGVSVLSSEMVRDPVSIARQMIDASQFDAERGDRAAVADLLGSKDRLDSSFQSGPTAQPSPQRAMQEMITEQSIPLVPPQKVRTPMRDGWLPARLTWWSKRSGIGKEETQAGDAGVRAESNKLPGNIEACIVEPSDLATAVRTDDRQATPKIPAQMVGTRTSPGSTARESASGHRTGFLNQWFKR